MSRLKTGISALLMTCLIILSACGRKEPQLFQQQFFEYFDTISQVMGFAPSEEAFAKRALLIEKDLAHYHELFDIYHSYSGMFNLHDLNEAAGTGPVKVDPEILNLLEFSVKLYDLTGGKVNIAMGSVLKLWHDCREEAAADPQKARLPDKEALAEAAAHTDIRGIIIDRRAGTAEIRDPKLRIDVGAVAKGYAAEAVIRRAAERGETELLLSLGGNVRALGAKGPQGKPWRVGVDDPNVKGRKKALLVTEIRDLSLVTSGLYERYYEVDGRRYHHIIDPVSLFPENRYLQVSILTKDSGLADGLSTALFNMDLAEGRALIEKLPDCEAMWVLPDGSIEMTEGFGAFAVK